MKSRSKYPIGPAYVTWLLMGLLSIIATAAASHSFAVLSLVATMLYCLPALLAEERRHRQRFPIYLLNLLLGWTLAGWVAALVWTYTTDIEPVPTPAD